MTGAERDTHGHFVLRRLLQVIPTAAGILLISFLLVHLAPGDPVIALAGDHGDAQYYAEMRQRFGLDQPMLRQLFTYASRVASGDLGFSYVQGRSAAAVIIDRVPATLLLTGSALLIAIVVSLPLGAYLALKPFGVRDAGINATVLALNSAPAFWIAQLALLTVALRLGIAPVQGMYSAGSNATGMARFADLMRHLALPALVLASQELAVFVRLTRSGLMNELASDYVRSARAKGVGENRIVLQHAMPRALLPVIPVIGARAGHLLAGAAIVEIVFGWPGMGRVLLGALQARDEPVLLGVFLIVAFTVMLANLSADLVEAATDPRVRLG
ncbi:MAG: ABC transporter permease [Gemmatimonadota bacterium]|nr:ABC transporter permease [Gemmatimonadota bacterium]